MQDVHWLNSYKICDYFCEALKIVFVEDKANNIGENNKHDGVYEHFAVWYSNMYVITT
jgi:hypothetical protein